MTEYSQRFLQYHAANPQVWDLFKRFALEAAGKRKRFSAQMIFERIRWYSQIETSGDVYKVNNNYRPDYARMFLVEYPQYKDLFSLRERRVADIVDTEVAA